MKKEEKGYQDEAPDIKNVKCVDRESKKET